MASVCDFHEEFARQRVPTRVTGFFRYKVHRTEWVDIINYSWPPKRQIRITSALNKLQIREELAIFGPPALIKLLGGTSLAPKSQNHGRNFKNEWFIYGLSTKYINFTQQKDYPSALKIAKKSLNVHVYMKLENNASE